MSENIKKNSPFMAEIETYLIRYILEQYEKLDEDNKKIADIWIKDGANAAKLAMIDVAKGNETKLKQMFG